MKTTEYPEFGEVLTAALEVYGAKLTPAAFGLWCGAFAAYSIADIRQALSHHIKHGKFAPRPADLIEIMQSNDGRPGAEESWARLSHAIGDENSTVVLTDEEREAFFVADSVADDMVAARMAFKETYQKAVAAARANGEPVVYSHILGHNAAGRVAPIEEALRLGWLQPEHVAGLLPNIEPERRLLESK